MKQSTYIINMKKPDNVLQVNADLTTIPNLDRKYSRLRNKAQVFDDRRYRKPKYKTNYFDY